MITYLKLTGFLIGLILNFNGTTMAAGVRRVEHPDLYLAKRRAAGNRRSK